MSHSHLTEPPLPPSAPSRVDWRSVVALNLVSAIAQVGQFGIAFTVLPLWLAQQGLDAGELGLFASALWFGQVPGFAWAPALTRALGARRVVMAGLACSVTALLLIPVSDGVVRLACGALAGLGLSLRWIGLEPWLYHIAPGEARGRLVGFHETLISLAPIVAPVLASWAGVTTRAPFALGIGFTILGGLPLLFARSLPAEAPDGQVAPSLGEAVRDQRFRLGVAIVLLGGAIEAAFTGLFPLFGAARHLAPQAVAALLTLFGVGGLVLQYAMGWLADHRGLAVATIVCALGALVSAVATALAQAWLALALAVFVLGGCVTAFLTLALVAAATARRGRLEDNVGRISMVYACSAIAGPLLAGAGMRLLGDGRLLWLLAGLAVVALAVVLAIARAGEAAGTGRAPSRDGGGSDC